MDSPVDAAKPAPGRPDPDQPASGRPEPDRPGRGPAVDSHAHVLDRHRFPLHNPHGYQPQPNECGTADEFLTVLDSHGMTHGLLVNPFAGYATDNGCMLDAMARAGGRLRGVALVGHEVGDDALRRLTDAGVVGARFNTLFSGTTSLDGPAGERLLARIRDHGWFAQIYFHDDAVLELLPILDKARIRVVVDHCACPDLGRPLDQPGFQAVLELGRRGNAAVKLSGPFRYSRRPWPYEDCDDAVAALIGAFTLDRCVWGSDWPFVRVPSRLDYGPVRRVLDRWLPDPADRHKVLWTTPSAWFGFSAAAGTPCRPGTP